MIAADVIDSNPPQHMIDVQVKGGYMFNLIARVVNRGNAKGAFVIQGPATLAPGKSADLKVGITTLGGIPVEQTAEILITASAATGPAHTDAVRAGFTVAPAK